MFDSAWKRKCPGCSDGQRLFFERVCPNCYKKQVKELIQSLK